MGAHVVEEVLYKIRTRKGSVDAIKSVAAGGQEFTVAFDITLCCCCAGRTQSNQIFNFLIHAQPARVVASDRLTILFQDVLGDGI